MDTPDPTRVILDGRPHWRFADGTTLPVVSGGAEGDPDPKDGDPDKDTTDHKAEAEKWKALARKHEDQAKANSDAAKRLKEIEDKGKDDLQRATERADEADKKASAAEARALRAEVALAKGLTATQAKRLVGDTQEELEADADELLKDLGQSKSSDGDERKPSTRPTERLSGGSDPTNNDTDEMDPAKLAESVPRW